MKLIALTDCPQGQAPGQIFEATDDAAAVLLQVGCAEPYTEPSTPDLRTPTPSRRYRRRDLSAED